MTAETKTPDLDIDQIQRLLEYLSYTVDVLQPCYAVLDGLIATTMRVALDPLYRENNDYEPAKDILAALLEHLPKTTEHSIDPKVRDNILHIANGGTYDYSKRERELEGPWPNPFSIQIWEMDWLTPASDVTEEERKTLLRLGWKP